MDPSLPRGSQSHLSPRNNDASSNELAQHRVRFAEGEPQASHKIHQPTARREGSSGATAPATQPAVFWDDRDNDANVEEGFTFYREGTPTPPEYEGHEKGYGAGGAAPVAEASTVGGGTIGSERGFNLGTPGQREVSLADSNEMSPTAKKRMLWAIIAVGILMLVGVGVGLGVGLTKGRSTASAEPLEGPSTSSSFPASAIGSSPTPTEPPPSPTLAGTENALQTTTSSAAGARPTYNSDCPSLNDTIYHVPGSTKRFLRLCGIDFSGSGATDLAQIWTGSMADCMNSCASFDQCTACAWGYMEGDDGDKHRCYMKKNLKTGHDAAKDWCLAILQ
ncbi:uncharacterized protein B0T15DRAFT_60001 [Chaetomium strumarium]|uniref:Apple domain-containing protein n=1 Tax=Chaetomium strumarium TaxID=1170767 RepID=A0AAJ0H3C0_9PEZI|nr:hypothetical protein B0T15DRAFT_60001 [Chaetomium strumarium]